MDSATENQTADKASLFLGNQEYASVESVRVKRRGKSPPLRK